MDPRVPFLRAICERPDDDAPRLVFADWLEENGGTVECDWCRGTGEDRPPEPVVVGNVRYVYTGPLGPCPKCRGARTLPDGSRERAEFVRLQIELARLEAKRADLFNDDRDWKECTEVSANWCPNCGDCTCPAPEDAKDDPGCPLHSPNGTHGQLSELCDRIIDARRRVEELWYAPAKGFDPPIQDWDWTIGKPVDGSVRPCGVVRRGFVESVALSAADWLTHADALIAQHPVTEVRLTSELDWHSPSASGALTLEAVGTPIQRRCKVAVEYGWIGEPVRRVVEYVVKAEWPQIKVWHLPAVAAPAGPG